MKEHTSVSLNDILSDRKSSKVEVFLKSLVVGVVTGVIVTGFRYILVVLSGLRVHLYERILPNGNAAAIIGWFAVLVATGIGLGFLIRRYPMIRGSGIPQIKGVLMRRLDSRWLPELIGKFFGGIAALGSGLSLGREGPSVQLGAEVGLGVSRLFGKHRIEEKYLITAGASAGVSAAFNAPLAGIIFSIEEMYRHITPLTLATVMISSLSASFISAQVFGITPVFHFPRLTVLPLDQYHHLVLLGIITGASGKFFNSGILASLKLYERIPSPRIELRPVLPLVTSGILGFFLFEITGGGHELVEQLGTGRFSIDVLLVFLLCKSLFTYFCYGSGVPGGIFLPVLVIGALIGNVYGAVMSSFGCADPAYMLMFLVLGMASFFTGVIRAPLTGTMLILEMTGSFTSFIPLVTVTLSSFVTGSLMRTLPIYESLLDRISAKTGSNIVDAHDRDTGKIVLEIPVMIDSRIAHLGVSAVPLPEHAIIVGIKRSESEIIPNPQFVIEPGDVLVVLTERCYAGKNKPILIALCESKYS